VVETYKSVDGTLPNYVKNVYETGLLRRYVPVKNKQREIVGSLVSDNADPSKIWYNAFEKDIAVANFYFSKPTTLEYRRSENMRLIDFVSQIGGLFGLCLGFSIISFIELFYWISIRLSRNFVRYSKE